MGGLRPPEGNVEILNQLPFRKYSALSDFLAFVGIYDDVARRRTWRELIMRHEGAIKGGVVVEVGAGFGEFSRLALEMGAKKVYAVERNPYAYEVLKRRLGRYGNVRVVKADAIDFVPDEEVDVLIHDFYGPLLYDESLYVLDNLPYSPRVALPNGGSLKVASVRLEDLEDDTVDEDVLSLLDGVIVADLFPIDGRPPTYGEREVANWRFGRGLNVEGEIDVGEWDGELLLFYLEVRHNGRLLCDSFTCTNWSLGWTPKSGDVFTITFKWGGDFTRTYFRWKV